MKAIERHYPFELVDVWQPRGGERVLIRPVHPQDAELTREFVRRMSSAPRYNRFHQPLAELTPAMARWATHVDYDRHFAPKRRPSWCLCARDDRKDSRIRMALAT